MLRLRLATLASFGLSLLFAGTTRASIITTVEAPGVQTSSAVDTVTINFDTASPNYHFQEIFNFPGILTATYDGNQFILPPDQYGGAGGTGQYIGVQQDTPTQDDSVTLTLSTPQAYFGLWLSAADPFNKIDFYNGGTLLYSFSAVGPEMSALPGTYLGNPNSGLPPTQNLGEKYAFVNFYAQTAGDMFNKIVFTNLYGGGTVLESDNHTFSSTLQAPAVPEPSTMVSSGIALMLLSGLWLRKKSGASTSL